VAAAVAAVSWIMGAPAVAAPLRNHPVTLSQPSGAVLHCFVSGDEYFNWIHDAAGYTIIPDPATGYYTYAVLEDGVIRASQYVVGLDDPAAAGLPRNALPRRDQLAQMLAAFPGPPVEAADGPHNAPRTGAINNLVVFIRFSDETNFPAGIGTYDAAFNAPASGANSMRNYFLEASYTQLTTSSTFYPAQNQTYTVSFQDSHARSYYQPYNVTTNPDGYQGGDNGTERRTREHTLLAAALNAIASLVPAGLQLDGDGDGYVDNICFVVRGQPTGWSSLLWPHMWSLYSQTVMINGKRAYAYNFQLESAFGVSVLCHEMFHSLGAPDLYHYVSNGISPVYKWDLMENNLNPPQHMSAYMKFKYGGWIASIPTISASGTYTLNPLTSATGNVYRINSPYSTSEYFVVEFRKRTGTFESSLPGEGILVYRINTTRTGNANGPPDEVYVYRPGGTPTANGTPTSANFNAGVGRTAIDDTTNPNSFLTAGGPGGLSLSSISAVGASMSFFVALPPPPYGTITGTVTNAGTAAPLANVSVRVYNASGSAYTTATTNASGVYVMTNLAAGTYYVRTSNSLGYVDELYDNLPCPGGACTVTTGTGVSVTAGATASGINFGLAMGGTITGTVKNDWTAAPLADVSVRVYNASGSSYSTVTTNASGVYTKTDLAAGTYYVRTSNSLGYVDELYDNLPCPGGACMVTTGTGVSVTAGATTGGINFGLARVGAGDFNGDRKSDILWHSATTGDVSVWMMNGAGRQSGAQLGTVADIGYQIAGVADFTGDGKADLLWHHATRGEMWLWEMDGTRRVSETWVATVPDTAYHVVGTGDYNGDGMADILWHHATTGEVSVWLMNGATRLSGAVVDTVGDTRYQIVGSGDVNGDGKADILWHHATAGYVSVWLMNGAGRQSGAQLGTVADIGYQIAGVADYTGDGKADLLWHHATRGEMWLWEMDGTRRVSETWVATVPDTAYHVVGTGDYNGDGKADILWHHATAGYVWVWLMNGATRLSETWVDTVPDVSYRIIKTK
jgi:M6 family metalloprotease-like protein